MMYGSGGSTRSGLAWSLVLCAPAVLGAHGADVPGEWFSDIFRIFCAFWLLQTSCHVLCVCYEVCGSGTGRNSGHSTYFHAPDASESHLSYFLRI